jgi:hypothetical protein
MRLAEAAAYLPLTARSPGAEVGCSSSVAATNRGVGEDDQGRGQLRGASRLLPVCESGRLEPRRSPLEKLGPGISHVIQRVLPTCLSHRGWASPPSAPLRYKPTSRLRSVYHCSRPRHAYAQLTTGPLAPCKSPLILLRPSEPVFLPLLCVKPYAGPSGLPPSATTTYPFPSVLEPKSIEQSSKP